MQTRDDMRRRGSVSTTVLIVAGAFAALAIALFVYSYYNGVPFANVLAPAKPATRSSVVDSLRQNTPEEYAPPSEEKKQVINSMQAESHAAAQAQTEAPDPRKASIIESMQAH